MPIERLESEMHFQKRGPMPDADIRRERRTSDRRQSDRRQLAGFLTVTELARYWSVSVDTIYRDISKGALRAYRIGSNGAIRVRAEDARKYGRPND